MGRRGDNGRECWLVLPCHQPANTSLPTEPTAGRSPLTLLSTGVLSLNPRQSGPHRATADCAGPGCPARAGGRQAGSSALGGLG